MAMQQEIVIDRSRYESSFRCPREYFWSYVYSGRGISPHGRQVYFAVGETVHVGVQSSMLQMSWDDTKEKMRGVWDAHTHIADGSSPIMEETRDEQWDLCVGLVYCWRLNRLEQFLSEYAVYNGMVEQEMVTTIYESPDYVVKLMSRPDVIVSRHSDNKLLLWELKTVGMVTQQWIKRWTHALQLLLQVYATQRHLISKGDEQEVVGIVVEGLVKGTRKRDSVGIKRQQSPLIYGYVKRGDGFIIKDQYSYVWKKGWDRLLISTCGIGVEEWIDGLSETTRQESTAVVPPLLASQQDMETVIKQVAHRAIALYQAQALATGGVMSVDEVFPQNFAACHEYDDCAFLDACFTPAVNVDPIESGLYEPRSPNHEYEKTVAPPGTAAEVQAS